MYWKLKYLAKKELAEIDRHEEDIGWMWLDWTIEELDQDVSWLEGFCKQIDWMNVEICRFRLCKEVEWTHGLLPKEETSVEEEYDVLTKFWDNFDLIVEVFWSSDECIEIKYNWIELEMSDNSSCGWLGDLFDKDNLFQFCCSDIKGDFKEDEKCFEKIDVDNRSCIDE